MFCRLLQCRCSRLRLLGDRCLVSRLFRITSAQIFGPGDLLHRAARERPVRLHDARAPQASSLQRSLESSAGPATVPSPSAESSPGSAL